MDTITLQGYDYKSPTQVRQSSKSDTPEFFCVYRLIMNQSSFSCSLPAGIHDVNQ